MTWKSLLHARQVLEVKQCARNHRQRPNTPAGPCWLWPQSMRQEAWRQESGGRAVQAGLSLWPAVPWSPRTCDNPGQASRTLCRHLPYGEAATVGGTLTAPDHWRLAGPLDSTSRLSLELDTHPRSGQKKPQQLPLLMNWDFCSQQWMNSHYQTFEENKQHKRGLSMWENGTERK